ncbi:unnamed protein product [Caretta caretta]
MAENPDGMYTLQSSLEMNSTEQRNPSAFTCRIVHNSQPPIRQPHFCFLVSLHPSLPANFAVCTSVRPRSLGNEFIDGAAVTPAGQANGAQASDELHLPNSPSTDGAADREFLTWLPAPFTLSLCAVCIDLHFGEKS